MYNKNDISKSKSLEEIKGEFESVVDFVCCLYHW